jgi:ubiquinone/menaquinone biosynthesis C-methylase UbiE
MAPESPFAGTAAYYHRFRPPYAPAAIDFVATTFHLDHSAHALDLGCGPGTLAIPLSRVAGEVTALDVDAGMLAEARRLAAARGRTNIRWFERPAEQTSLALGRFRLATLGQSFHWMDRDAVLQRLGQVIEDGGGLALINPGARRPQESWEPVLEEVVTSFLGPRRLHPRRNPEPTHQPALRRSKHFARFTEHEFANEITRDIASITGCAYSFSYAARHRFGDRAPEFETALAEALLARNPTGVFHERLETEVLVAMKSE